MTLTIIKLNIYIYIHIFIIYHVYQLSLLHQKENPQFNKTSKKKKIFRSLSPDKNPLISKLNLKKFRCELLGRIEKKKGDKKEVGF